MSGNAMSFADLKTAPLGVEIAPLEPADFVIAVGNESRVLVDQA